jgi:hypothetical protein
MSYIIWAIAGYFTAKKVAEKNPQMEISPVAYCIGSLIFSYLGAMSWLGYRVCDNKGNKNGKALAIVGLVLTVLINIAILM